MTGSCEHQKGYVDSTYLKTAAQLLQDVKTRSYEACALRLGAAVLDVGCGPGTDTIPLADRVTHTGRVIGLDHDPRMVAEAEERRGATKLRSVKHLVGDASQMPFWDDEFDAVRSERMLQHVDPLKTPRVFSEMHRVLRPNGVLVVVDTDFGTVSIDMEDTDLERRMVRFFGECRHLNPYSGRQLFRRFQECGLVVLKTEVFPFSISDYTMARKMMSLDDTEKNALETGVFTANEIARWRQAHEKAQESGTFFFVASLVMVVGRKNEVG